jgi:hypothetical protein
MGSVPKRYCARGSWCTQHGALGEPAVLGRYNKDDICGQCRRIHSGGYRASKGDRWMDEVAEAAGVVLSETTEAKPAFKASLWDLFALDPHNGGIGKFSARGEVIDRLSPRTLIRLRRWLEENSDRAIEVYGFGRWKGLRDSVALIALLKQIPSGTQLLPDEPEGGLPLQGVSVRADGKKWDLTKPIRAELLRRQRRYFSEREMARILGIKRTFLRNMLGRMKKAAFTLDRFAPNVLDKIVRGEDRGPKKRGP